MMCSRVDWSDVPWSVSVVSWLRRSGVDLHVDGFGINILVYNEIGQIGRNTAVLLWLGGKRCQI